ncbi:hypothetical protein TNCV_1844001 [Trichonephila clavipes]|nr:hypothetical protein TNCV_1844001 [Trichonephila clavipes]
MDVFKHIVPSWHGGTLNSHRAASREVDGRGREGLFTPKFLAAVVEWSGSRTHYQQIESSSLGSTEEPTCRGDDAR